MTKAEILKALEKYDDDENIWTYGLSTDSTYLSKNNFAHLASVTEIAAMQKEVDIKWAQEQYNRSFDEMEDWLARRVIAEDHLDKRESKTWRAEYDRANKHYLSAKSTADHYARRLMHHQESTVDSYLKDWGYTK